MNGKLKIIGGTLLFSLLFIILFLVFLGPKKTGSTENYYIVAPHHSITGKALHEFYKDVGKKYTDIENIVIISPNHYLAGTQFLESFKQEGQYCYSKNIDSIDDKKCINGGTLDFYDYKPSDIFDLADYNKYKKGGIFGKDKFIIFEHGIGEHFRYINKYIQNYNKVFPIVIGIENDSKFTKTKEALKKIQDYNFGEGKTLFIMSVDFSHHVFDKLAIFHDMRSVDELNKKVFKTAEVDCSNCLFLGKTLAESEGKNIFTLSNRTSSSKIMEKNLNYDNTTHIFGEYISGDKNQKKKAIDTNIKFFNKYSSVINTSQSSKNETTPEENNDGVIYGMFFGDSHLTRSFNYKKKYKHIIPASYPNKKEYFKCFHQNKDLSKNLNYWKNRMFVGIDYVGVNFETSMCEKDYIISSQKEITFNTSPEYLRHFSEVGINMFNLANNHAYDYGNTCYNRTKEIISNQGLHSFGEGRGKESSIFKSEKNGVKIAYMGINDTTYSWSLEDKVKKIKELTVQGYRVIVNIHWGLEYKTVHSKRQEKVAYQLVDAGANMIVGHHPHVVQDFEEYRGVPIFYSLGNFIFDQSTPDTLDGMGIIYRIDEKILKYSIINFKRKQSDFSINCESWN